MIGDWLRFCLVGAVSAALNTAIIVLLTELLHLHYLLSVLACFLIVTMFGFVMNRSWSFRIKGSGRHTEMMRYVCVAAIGVVLTLSFSWALVQIKVPYYVAVYAAAILLAPYNFLAHRFFSFQLRYLGK
jgi:putative flippase GtrA